MNQRPHDIPAGCAEWKDEIKALLELPADHPVRRNWENHAKDCSSCRAVLEDETGFQEMFDRIPDPGPAFVSGRVMRAVRLQHRQTGPFRKRDLLYGLIGSAAGVILGLWLTGVVSNGSTQIQPAAVYAAAIADIPTGLDELVGVFTTTEEEDN